VTGLSQTQVTRLVGQFVKGGEVKGVAYRRHQFATRFGRKDSELLAAVDGAHDTLSGPLHGTAAPPRANEAGFCARPAQDEPGETLMC